MDVINSDSQSLAAALGNLSLGSSDHAAAVAENEARKFAAEISARIMKQAMQPKSKSDAELTS